MEMNREQFNRWIEEWATAYPESYQRLQKIGQDTDVDPMRVFDAWYDIAFSTIEFHHAREALLRLQREGGYTVWKLQETPAIFRALAAEIRLAESDDQWWRGPDTSGRRYDCPICRDAGIVICWHVERMVEARKAVLGGRAGPPDGPGFVVTECAVACSCGAGEKRKIYRTRYGRERELPTYNPTNWVMIDPDLDDAANSRQLWEWAQAYQPKT